MKLAVRLTKLKDKMVKSVAIVAFQVFKPERAIERCRKNADAIATSSVDTRVIKKEKPNIFIRIPATATWQARIGLSQPL